MSNSLIAPAVLTDDPAALSLIRPGRPGYAETAPWNQAVRSEPQAVVRARSAAEIAAAVRYAAGHGLRAARAQHRARRRAGRSQHPADPHRSNGRCHHRPGSPGGPVRLRRAVAGRPGRRRPVRPRPDLRIGSRHRGGRLPDRWWSRAAGPHLWSLVGFRPGPGGHRRRRSHPAGDAVGERGPVLGVAWRQGHPRHRQLDRTGPWCSATLSTVGRCGSTPPTPARFCTPGAAWVSISPTKGPRRRPSCSCRP